MLIVLAPSETKTVGGDGPARDITSADGLAGMSFPALNPVRAAIATDLVQLCAQDVDAACAALKVGPAKRGDVELTAQLRTSPTMPAILRYTGVQYDALDAGTLTHAQQQCLAIGSALFGVVAAADPIPFYRLSGGSKLPQADGATPTMKARWGSAITHALTSVQDEQLVIDLRSGTYQQLGAVKDAVTVRVESEYPDGSRKVVSHFNKHYKGLLARALAEASTTTECRDIDDVAQVATAAGYRMERTSPTQLTMVVSA
ncbi:peroxide stress protein YaaA [Corynebacterium sp. 13CS0277]|uniref:peroxide stress protein YaaA n=1 Tax=Corynebacterium sp. 13CS0277 TaxID=2071994 RepID=UPI000D035C43|nr:peroxide stress protein YaaA [Corynebacterium sp. 13CS0277]PRQ12595.1 peroxide stress protein YaaA [Corynebacterium sp. 13CS0277]